MDTSKFQVLAGANTNAGTLALYQDTTKTLAQQYASGFFNDKTLVLPVAALIQCVASNGVQLLKVTASGKATSDSTVVVTTSVITAASAKAYVTVAIADLGAAASTWAPCPVTGTITGFWVTAAGARTANPAVITIEQGGVALTGGVATVASAGAAGDQYAATAITGANVCGPTVALEIISDGGPTNSVAGMVVVEISV